MNSLGDTRRGKKREAYCPAAAKDDILREFRYYLIDQDNPDLANRFLEAVDSTIGKTPRTPNAGAPKHLSNEALADLRSWPVEDVEEIRVYYLPKRRRCA